MAHRLLDSRIAQDLHDATHDRGHDFCLCRKLGRGPLAAVLWYAIMLFPALGFFNVYFMRFAFVQDHFQYFAGPGLFALGAAGGARLLLHLGQKAGWRQGRCEAAAAVAAVCLLLPLGLLTARQGRIYRDSETLWQDTVTRNPAAAIAHNNLGRALLERGEREAALGHFRESARLDPGLESTQFNWAVALDSQGDWRGALEHYREALRIFPNYADALSNLGDLFYRRGDSAGAIRWLEAAVRSNPRHLVARVNLGILLAERGRTEEALAHFQEAVRLDPFHADALFNLGKTLSDLGRSGEGAVFFDRALRAMTPAEREQRLPVIRRYQAGRS